MKNEKKSKLVYVQFTRRQAGSLYTSATISNLMSAFLAKKFGSEFTGFMNETALRWIEQSKNKSEDTSEDTPADATQGARPQSANTSESEPNTENQPFEILFEEKDGQ